MNRTTCRCIGWRSFAVLLVIGSTGWAAQITWYRLGTPDGSEEIAQASGLHYGSYGPRKGLWTACDRNGGPCAGKIYFIADERIASARPGATITASEEFFVTDPAEGWNRFAASHPAVGKNALADLRQRVEDGARDAEGMRLDLEAITIGFASSAPSEPRLFVVAEEPNSLVLELVLEPAGTTTAARLVDVFRYYENDAEHGTDFNDGLEGLAYAGSPGEFYWAEEGTRLHRPDAHPRLFFADPRLGLARLALGQVAIEQPISDRLTKVVRAQRKGDAQTLNDLCLTPQGILLAVDRNGGWILRIDPKRATAERWLNLYDLEGVNLRQTLADFPAPRHMPYISIEGIAVDDAGAIWLVDDPAMPEEFRSSCAVRISGVTLPPATSHPASQTAP